MTGDPELDDWRQQWQARDAVPAELRRRVEGEIRSARYEMVAPLAVTVLFGGSTLAWALVSGQRDAIVLAAATWAFIAITWLTSLALSRRIGQRGAPASQTTTAFLDFAILTCRSKRAAIAAAAVLAPIFTAFMLVWRYRTSSFDDAGAYLLSGPVFTFLGIALVLGVAGVRWHRALGAELDSLRAMRQRYEERDR